MGWLTAVTTEAFFAAQFFSAAAVVGSGGVYVIQPWKVRIILAIIIFYKSDIGRHI